ncbi:hypothetical protein MSIMFI_03779 [Mycobacterium simulans]|uniref:hypothetical protein n=1 Tax=Mycobacterium simulans TaxID=627089 RepID=UPI00174C8112|nr:hypothetical protein [Mycobacterium simulans]SON62258.1 hypothetical protein MSIMFI_03779 [Mycobacterium simulans]
MIFTTLGVLTALYVAVWREPRKADEDRASRAEQAAAERERHDTQIAALRQAEDERLAAQARRIVPAIFRGNIVSNILWNLRIDNISADVISELKIDIIIHDGNGNPVPHGYRLATKESLAEIMATILLPEFTRGMNMLAATFDQYIAHLKASLLSVAENLQTQEEANAFISAVTAEFANAKLDVNEQTAAMLQAQFTHAVQTRLTDDWPTFLAPGQFAAIAIETTRPDYTPHLQIQFEDSSHLVWRRTDTEGPKRVHDAPAPAPEQPSPAPTARPKRWWQFWR